MKDLEKPLISLPVDDDVDSFEQIILNNLRPGELFQKGIKAKLLEPGKKWVTGKICFRIAFEFVPDELESAKLPSDSASTLDDLRKMSL